MIANSSSFVLTLIWLAVFVCGCASAVATQQEINAQEKYRTTALIVNSQDRFINVCQLDYHGVAYSTMQGEGIYFKSLVDPLKPPSLALNASTLQSPHSTVKTRLFSMNMHSGHVTELLTQLANRQQLDADSIQVIAEKKVLLAVILNASGSQLMAVPFDGSRARVLLWSTSASSGRSSLSLLEAFSSSKFDLAVQYRGSSNNSMQTGDLWLMKLDGSVPALPVAAPASGGGNWAGFHSLQSVDGRSVLFAESMPTQGMAGKRAIFAIPMEGPDAGTPLVACGGEYGDYRYSFLGSSPTVQNRMSLLLAVGQNDGRMMMCDLSNSKVWNTAGADLRQFGLIDHSLMFQNALLVNHKQTLIVAGRNSSSGSTNLFIYAVDIASNPPSSPGMLFDTASAPYIIDLEHINGYNFEDDNFPSFTYGIYNQVGGIYKSGRQAAISSTGIKVSDWPVNKVQEFVRVNDGFWGWHIDDQSALYFFDCSQVPIASKPVLQIPPPFKLHFDHRSEPLSIEKVGPDYKKAIVCAKSATQAAVFLVDLDSFASTMISVVDSSSHNICDVVLVQLDEKLETVDFVLGDRRLRRCQIKKGPSSCVEINDPNENSGSFNVVAPSKKDGFVIMTQIFDPDRNDIRFNMTVSIPV